MNRVEFKEHKIQVLGHEVKVIDFGYAQYMYPSFNGNAEFKVSKSGFKSLAHYLRNINWLINLDNPLTPNPPHNIKVNIK